MNREKTKIQPIQPKKKPIPIAVLPKPSGSIKSNFNPNIKTLTLKNDIALNINTLKRWVLPPRPRPGRKPENGSNSTTTLNSTVLGQSAPTTSNANHLDDAKSSTSTSSTLPKLVNSLDTTKDPPKADSPETLNLKMDYLSKLKEQELVLNYIDIINNQIKQLSFIKNGYMTFDTLNQIGSDSNSEKTIEPLGHDINSRINSIDLNSDKKTVTELENINNFQDLNNFLDYLIKSSNLIHRVTKNYQSDGINEQIDKYLKARKKSKKSGSLSQLMSQTPQIANQQTSSSTAKTHTKFNKLSNNLLNENNLFDEMTINGNERKCPICKHSSPCFCLDIDKNER